MATRTLNVLLTGDSKALRASFLSAQKGATTAKAGLAAAAVGAGLAAKAIYDVGAEFDDAYDKIRVGTGRTGKELDKLKGDFKNVVSSVPADFGDASEAIAELNTRLGVSGKPLRGLSKQFTELSRITDTDVGENVKTVARAFGDWEVSTKNQGKALDTFFRAAQGSGAPVAELADLVVKFGAPLRQFGFDLGEATAMFASFEKAGVNIQTMVPGLKFALKTFLSEGLDPKQALKKTFAGIEDGSIKASESLKLFGQRAGADMVEAVEQGRFKFGAFTREIETGNDTIRRAGRETMDAAEHFQLLGNKLKVWVEPAATAVYEAIGVFAGELTKLDFQNPISGAVAFGVAFTGLATAAVLARDALAATFLLATRHPFGVLMLGVGLAAGALIGLNSATEKTVSTYQRLRGTMGALNASSKRLNDARKEEKTAAQRVKHAEQRLLDARKEHGPNSRQARKSEAHFAEALDDSARATRRLKNLEKLQGAERRAAMAVLRVDIRKLARETVTANAVAAAEAQGLRGILQLYKNKEVSIGQVRTRLKQYEDATSQADRKNRNLNETLGRAGRELGPKWASELEKIADRTRKSYGKVDRLARALKGLPNKRKTEVEVEITMGGFNLPGGLGGSGSGWPLTEHIDAKVTKRVQGAAARNPMGVLGASMGVGGLGGAGAGHVSGFTPLASRFGLEQTSGYRPGDDGYHGINRARDYGGSAAAMLGFAKFMLKGFGSKLRELIHTPLGVSVKDGRVVPPYAAADHYDHVHVALQKGGVVSGTGTGDKVPGALPNGSFVLNSVATAAAGFQKGGMVRVMLEPGERVFMPGEVARVGMGNLEAVNRGIPRQQGGAVAGLKLQGGGVVQSMAQSLFNHGFDKEAVAGIIGNAYGESNWNPGATDGAGNGGLFGFTTSPVSLNDLKNYAAKKGVPWTNTKMQTQFMLHHGEPTGLALRSKLNAASTVAEATAIFMNDWERPGIPRLDARVEGASKAYKMIGGMDSGKGGKGKGGGAKKAKPKFGLGGATAVELPPLKPGKVPGALKGLGAGITSLFTGPGMSREQRFGASEMALGMAEGTAGSADDRAILQYQLGASQQRKKAIRKELRRLNKRLGERLSPQQRKQVLGKRNALTEELGTMQGQIGSAREGLKDLQPTARDFADLQLARAEATPDKGDDIAALQRIEDVARQELAQAEQSGDPREIAEATRNLTSAAQALNDAQPTAQDWADRDLALAQLTDTLEDDKAALEKLRDIGRANLDAALRTADPRDDIEAANYLRQILDQLKQSSEQPEIAEEMKALRKELELTRRIAEDELATSAAVARRALADIVAGQLGPRSEARARTAGAGTLGGY